MKAYPKRIQAVRFLGMLSALLTLLLSGAAQAKSTGVSDDRVSLPEGPGSLEGVGENASIDPNMGQMSYAVDLTLPAGYPGMTPSMDLNYSSGGGNGVVGMGWSISDMKIERLTMRGLPDYDRDDEFAANGGDQLVLIPETDPPVYRSRFERGFVRYTWREAGDGSEGYWTAEYPDGRIAYFGADAEGNPVDESRMSGEHGTFRYELVEIVDPFGHAVRYEYEKDGDVPLLTEVAWVFEGESESALYSMTFEYESRQDKVSDCKAGFEELLEKRLKSIQIFSRGTMIHRYDLVYESYETSGGFSRLSTVELYGLGGVAYPVNSSFEYSKGLGVDCTESDCRKPYVVGMGSLGLDLQTGKATLIDINGDSLPDVVDTSVTGGHHRFFINRLNTDGTQIFQDGFDSDLGTVSGHTLGSPYVQVMDVDGNGFTDMINTQTGIVLKNTGSGDWTEAYSLWDAGDGGTPDMGSDFDPSDGELRTVRFIDYDNDKKIDLIRSLGSDTENVTTIYRNVGNGGFESDENAEPIGAGFESDSLELSDMNGDGLLDPVQVLQEKLRYRLNLGWGRWGDWVEIGGFSFTSQEAIDAELEDLNGDALSDLVLVTADEVHYWLNRNGESFDSMKVIGDEDVEGDLPIREQGTTVLYADMNGNGSNDIVWITASGVTSYLELFPVRPNLLSRIRNGFGMVTEATYGTAVSHLARDREDQPWPYALPQPMLVVDRLDSYDLHNQLHEITDYVYHNGFYDGKEKAFRGFEKVEEMEPAGPYTPEGSSRDVYDVGVADAYRNGLLLRREIREEDRILQVVQQEYDFCEVAGVPDEGLRFPVRSVCLVSEINESREGLTDSSQWVITEKRYTYDGYGNVTMKANLGITSVGGAACGACDGLGRFGAPCGAGCLGDESYESKEYVQPESNEGRWLLRLPVREREYGVADSNRNPAGDVYTEKLTYYDGESYTGLALGQATQGKVSRVTERKDTSGALITVVRNRHDSHGNVVETLDPLGTVEGVTHRRAYTYDVTGMRIIQTEVLLEDSDGAYRLKREYAYDEVWDKLIENTLWIAVRNNVEISPRNSVSYSYDEFGRLSTQSYPGENPGDATETYTYDLGSPISRVIREARSLKGGAVDIRKVSCYDGFGRVFQVREMIEGNRYHVNSYKIFNNKGELREMYQPYDDIGDACDSLPPPEVHSIQFQFDALGRTIRAQMPQIDGQAMDQRTVHEPMKTITYDLEDSNESGPFYNTPTIEIENGQGDTIEKHLRLTANGEPIVYRYFYDELGRLSEWEDATGGLHVQTYDFLERAVSVLDPDRGLTRYTYDDAGMMTHVEDARGVVRRYEYDGTNRVIAEWEEGQVEATKISTFYDFRGECDAAKCTNIAGYMVRSEFPMDNGKTSQEYHGYDVRGQVRYFARVLDDKLFESTTDYDNVGRPVTSHYPNHLSIEQQPDGLGRLVKIPGYIDRVTYNAFGQLDEIEMANGAVTQQTYDAHKRLKSLKVTGPDSGKILDYSYTRNREGHITEIVDGRADDGHPSGSAQYAYDALYRLTEARLDPARTVEETLTFAYDRQGRLTSKTSSRGEASPDHVGAYTYGENGAGPNALTTAGSKRFSYDAAGHMVERDGTALQWDFKGRLVSSTDPLQNQAVYLYGTGDQRLIKRENGSSVYYFSPDFEVRNGVATIYLRVDDLRIVKITDPTFAALMLSDLAPASGDDDALVPQPDGAITAADAWIAYAVGQGLFELQTAALLSTPEELLEASLDHLLSGEQPSTRYLHTNHRGDISAITDENGQVVGRSEYYPYGLTRYENGEKDAYSFSNKETDSSTGLAYFGARYHDMWTGRWVSPDPAFQVNSEDITDYPDESADGYGFNRSNPVNYIDRDGQFANFLIGGIIGAITGFVGECIAQKMKGNKIFSKHTMLSALGMSALGFGVGLLTSGIGVVGMATFIGIGVSNIAGGIGEGIGYNVGKTWFRAPTKEAGGSVGSILGSALGGLAVGLLASPAHGLKAGLTALTMIGKTLFTSVAKAWNKSPTLSGGDGSKLGQGANKVKTGVSNKWSNHKTKKAEARTRKMDEKFRKMELCRQVLKETAKRGIDVAKVVHGVK